MGTNIGFIPQRVNIYYDTYANIAAIVGMKAQDLAFATDRIVLYRYSGAAWQPITISSRNGADAAKGVATDYPESSLYQAEDTNKLYMVMSGAWVYVSAVPPIQAAWEGDLAAFQANAATSIGALLNPTRVNDNNPGTECYASVINMGVEVDFGDIFRINRWRQFGSVNNGNGDGRWKIQYYNLESYSWTDWVTGIVARGSADWSGYTAETEVYTNAIRLICTALDTSTNRTYIAELDISFA